MRLSTFLPLGSLVLAAPSQFPLIDKVTEGVQRVEHVVESWFDEGREWVKQEGIVYELVTHPEFPDYQIRVTEPKICDAAVQQYSGYLDISDGKHLFFWFFESRTTPEEDPLVLWLNGGPGCSSITGLLFELGPCAVSQGGANTTYNAMSWTAEANMIFLDQPINVGYSYSDDGSTVSTTPVAAEDVWSFLQLFVSRYSKYSKLPFHISGESYAGTYLPNIGSVIHKHNKEIASSPSHFAAKGVKYLNLESILIGNGLTSPVVQFPAVAEYACEGPYPVFDKDGPECASLYSKAPTCVRLIEGCYKYSSRLTCVPASLYCWSQMYGSFQNLGLNPYDVRRKCDRDPSKDGPLCYPQMGWIENFMNDPSRKKELGVSGDVTFQSCNTDVNRAFFGQGDSMHDTAALLPELLADGIRLLIYAGNADFMCNAIGNFEWVYAMDSVFGDEFRNKTSEKYVTLINETIAGEFRSAGGKGAGNLTYVQIYEAGHMVPYDQPEAALDMFTRWIKDVPLTT